MLSGLPNKQMNVEAWRYMAVVKENKRGKAGLKFTAEIVCCQHFMRNLKAGVDAFHFVLFRLSNNVLVVIYFSLLKLLLKTLKNVCDPAFKN